MKKVLVADDEEGLRALVSATLGNDDRFQLLIAQDGQEALEIARREKPELVFLDISMPRQSGLQVCEQLKSDPATAGIQIVMLSAMADNARRRGAMGAGADGYVTKPFSPTNLLARVEELL